MAPSGEYMICRYFVCNLSLELVNPYLAQKEECSNHESIVAGWSDILNQQLIATHTEVKKVKKTKNKNIASYKVSVIITPLEIVMLQ